MVINLNAYGVSAVAVALKHDFFTPTPAQTIFVLAQGTPVDNGDIVFVVNRVNYAHGVAAGNYFTVSGTTVTWTNVFTLATTDEVEIVYSVAS
jgi:hypothetical protein